MLSPTSATRMRPSFMSRRVPSGDHATGETPLAIAWAPLPSARIAHTWPPERRPDPSWTEKAIHGTARAEAASEGCGEVDGTGVDRADGAADADSLGAGTVAGSLTRPDPTVTAPATRAVRTAAAARETRSDRAVDRRGGNETGVTTPLTRATAPMVMARCSTWPH